MKPTVKEVIVVEGRYDKNTLLQVVNATVVETGGFSIFNDREKMNFLRKLAEKRGLVILTDSDGAGFVIRNHIKGSIPSSQIKEAYIPDLFGKEKRKRTAGKEGKLGVEGMKPDVILNALKRSGATIDCEAKLFDNDRITKADMMDKGLIGPNSAQRRANLLRHLDLPEHLTANALLDVLNMLYSREEFLRQ